MRIQVSNWVSWGLIIVIVAFVFIWIAGNYQALERGLAGETYYTQLDIENAYQNGSDSVGLDIVEQEITIDDVISAGDNLRIANDNLSVLITQLQTVNAELFASNLTLTESLQYLLPIAEDLQSRLSDNQAQYDILEAEYYTLYDILQSLLHQINSYQDESLKIVEFYVYDTLCDIQIVSCGGCVRAGEILVNFGRIVAYDYGWSLDRVTMIDLDNYIITQDTKLYFHCDDVDKLMLNYYVGNELYYSQKIAFANEIVNVENPITIEGYKFVGWENSDTLIGDNLKLCAFNNFNDFISRYISFNGPVNVLDFVATYGAYVTFKLTDYPYPETLPDEWIGNAEDTIELVLALCTTMDVQLDNITFEPGIDKQIKIKSNNVTLTYLDIQNFNVYVNLSDISLSDITYWSLFDGGQISNFGEIIHLYYRSNTEIVLITDNIHREGELKLHPGYYSDDYEILAYCGGVGQLELILYDDSKITVSVNIETTIGNVIITETVSSFTVIDINYSLRLYIEGQKLQYKFVGGLPDIKNIEFTACYYGLIKR